MQTEGTTLSSGARAVDVLRVMDRNANVLALKSSQTDAFEQRQARAAVADLIAERDRLANIVRSHEAQIARMTAGAGALSKAAAKANVALRNYRLTGKPDYEALTEASDALEAAMPPFLPARMEPQS